MMIAAILSLLVVASQQVTAPPLAPPGPVPIDPDVLISVRAHADQVTWRQVGNIRVRAWSEPSGRVVEQNLTTGLPRPIPGQRTFRDVEWTLRAGACMSPAQSLPEGEESPSEPRCQQTPVVNQTGATPQ